MKVVESPLDIQERHTYFKLNDLRPGLTVHLKLEGLNRAGSIKLKTAIGMIEDLEERAVIRPGRNHIVESSSGNLGVALSMVCKVKGYAFTCVTDPNAAESCLSQMRLYGAKVIVVSERDENNGYLNTRIRLIQKLVARDTSLIWTNQYKNAANPHTHAHHTAREIHQDFPNLSYLFVGAGTTGTLRGCVEFYRYKPQRPTLVAVDTAGSVTFGGPSGKRHVPGLGTSRRPEIFVRDHVDALLHVPEVNTIKVAREILDRYQLLIGGSTATVLCGLMTYSACQELHGTVIAISPDFGEKYIDTIFNPEWIDARFPALTRTVNSSPSNTIRCPDQIYPAVQP